MFLSGKKPPAKPNKHKPAEVKDFIPGPPLVVSTVRFNIRACRYTKTVFKHRCSPNIHLSSVNKKAPAFTRIPRPLSAANPTKWSAVEGEEIPTRAQFSAKPETERWWEFLSWQRVKDSNPHIQSQSLLCYLYTNPLYCFTARAAHEQSLLYRKTLNCQGPFCIFSKICLLYNI